MGKSPLELATQIARSFFAINIDWTARREMIFLFALNHQRTRQNLLGKGNQFLCQQRNPRVSSPFRVASKANRERTREWGPRQSRERLSHCLVLSVTLSLSRVSFASRATRVLLLMISHEGRSRARLACRFPAP